MITEDRTFFGAARMAGYSDGVEWATGFAMKKYEGPRETARAHAAKSCAKGARDGWQRKYGDIGYSDSVILEYKAGFFDGHVAANRYLMQRAELSQVNIELGTLVTVYPWLRQLIQFDKEDRPENYIATMNELRRDTLIAEIYGKDAEEVRAAQDADDGFTCSVCGQELDPCDRRAEEERCFHCRELGPDDDGT